MREYEQALEKESAALQEAETRTEELKESLESELEDLKKHHQTARTEAENQRNELEGVIVSRCTYVHDIQH